MEPTKDQSGNPAHGCPFHKDATKTDTPPSTCPMRGSGEPINPLNMVGMYYFIGRAQSNYANNLEMSLQRN